MAIGSLQDIRDRMSGKTTSSDEEETQSPILDELSNVPGYALDAAENLPGNLWNVAKQVPSTAKKIVMHPVESLQDIAGAVARSSQRNAASLLEGGEYLTRKGAEGMGYLRGYKDFNVPEIDARESMGLGQKNPVDLGAMIESKNPDPLLSQGTQYGLGAAALGPGLGRVAISNALNMASQAEPDERIKAATQGTVGLLAPPIIAKGAMKGFDMARPSNLFMSNLSKEDLAKNLEAAKGTNTSLGDVIQSPMLKNVYETILPNVPFSGTYKTMQENSQNITQSGQNILDTIESKLPPGDKTQILQTALKSASNEASTENAANYKTVDDIADSIGLQVGRDKFQAKAKDVLQQINESPELKREFDPTLLADISEYANNPKGNTLKLSNIFKGKLNDRASDFYDKGAKYEYGIMKGLKDALGKDIGSAIKDSNHTGLKNAYDYAQKQHGQNQQFEDPDIVKFTRKGGDIDLMLSHFLKKGANDRSRLLGKLTAKLPDSLKELPLYMHLSKAIEDEGGLNPIKLNTLFNDLGKNQKDILISDPATRQALEQYSRKVNMNKESFDVMRNPKTGHRNSLIGVIEGMGGGMLTSGTLHGIPGAAATVGAAGLAARGASKYLSSESVRNAIVKKMIQKKK